MRVGWLGAIARWLVRLVAAVAILLSAAWVALALWFQLPIGGPVLFILLGAWLAFSTTVLAFELAAPSWRIRLAYGIALGFAGLWWFSIQPSNDRTWETDVEHGVTGVRNGDIVTLEDVRDFDWRSEADFTPRWETRRVDLRSLRSVDLFLSYWSGPAIAHTLVSFGFADGQHVVFSAEIRPEKGEAFSEIGGFFKQFELVLIGADERDIIRLRTNVRGEDVYRYPLEMPQAGMRALFLDFVALGNDLDRQPRFYNTLTANCTTVVFRLIRALDPGLPLDYRILLSGYLPGYIYDRQGYRMGLSLEEFRRRAAVSALGKAAGDAPDYSERIRTQPATQPTAQGLP